MATPFSLPVQMFLREVEKDRDFFHYSDLSREECMKMAEQRAKNILIEAIQLFILKATPDIDLNDYNAGDETFSEDLTNQEIYLLSRLMYQIYLERDVAHLKGLSVNFTSTDLRVLDPSNARISFLKLYEVVCNENISYIEAYKSKDRVTGEIKTINYASYDED